jgi:hypothetical protein
VGTPSEKAVLNLEEEEDETISVYLGLNRYI